MRQMKKKRTFYWRPMARFAHIKGIKHLSVRYDSNTVNAVTSLLFDKDDHNGIFWRCFRVSKSDAKKGLRKTFIIKKKQNDMKLNSLATKALKRFRWLSKITIRIKNDDDGSEKVQISRISSHFPHTRKNHLIKFKHH